MDIPTAKELNATTAFSMVALADEEFQSLVMSMIAAAKRAEYGIFRHIPANTFGLVRSRIDELSTKGYHVSKELRKREDGDYWSVRISWSKSPELEYLR